MAIQKIIVPIDFSDCSITALKYAINISMHLKAKISVVHAYTAPATFSEAILPDRFPDIESEAKQKFDRIRSELPGIEDVFESFLVDHAFPTDVIRYITKTREADMIVMGTKGASGIKELLIGSNALDVVNHSEIPVLVVPEMATVNNPHNIALAVDYSAVPPREVFNPLISMADGFRTGVHILNISPTSRIGNTEAQQARKFEQYFKQLRHNYHFEVDTNVEDGINTYVLEQGINLLSIVRREHTVFEQWFQPGTMKKMVLHTQVPLLVLPDIDR